MLRTSLLAGAVTASALFAPLPQDVPPAASPSELHPERSCTLAGGPVRVEVLSLEGAGGLWSAELELEPRLDVDWTQLVLELPHGGAAEVVGQSSTGSLEAGTVVRRSVLFAPVLGVEGEGAIGTVRVEAGLPQPDGSVERASSQRPLVLRPGRLASNARRVQGPRGTTLEVPRRATGEEAR